MVNHDLHPLSVIGLRQPQDDQPPVLVMQDDLGRNLEIAIGLCEALAIQLALNKTAIGRPLTHDLILSIADHLQVTPLRVVIDDISKGTYYARLILTSEDGDLSLDCRPSDGVAIALRAEVPILAAETVLLGEQHEG
jgi:bifunctional DNase/RNase